MKAQNFFDFIQEDAEDLTPAETRRLQDMGIEPLDPDEAWTELVDTWYADPVVKVAVQTLNDKFAELWDQYYRAEYEEDWDQKEGWITSEVSTDEIGTFDYFLINR